MYYQSFTCLIFTNKKNKHIYQQFYFCKNSLYSFKIKQYSKNEKKCTRRKNFFFKKNRHQNSLIPEIFDDLIITIIFSWRHNSPF